MWNGLAALTLPVLFGGKANDSECSRERGKAQRVDSDTPIARPATTDAQDILLVTRIREGVEVDARTAFDLLYERLFDRLFKFAIRLLGDADSACDVVQEAFVLVWVSRTTWYAPGGSDAYLYAAVRNQAFKRFRHQGVIERAEPARMPLPSGLTGPDSSAEASEFDQAFRAALLTLPERRRTAFLLHAVDGMSYEAIGQVLGISKPAAFKQVMAAIGMLRNQLSRFAG